MIKLTYKGWVCPKCNRVYAPWMPECTKCGNISIGYKYTVNPTTTGNPHNLKSEGSKTDEESGTWCLNKESEEE